MILQDIIYFMEIAEGNTLSSVAQHHNISQSALSKMLSRLEKELNVELFNRQHHPLTLTMAGSIFYADIKAIKPHYDNILQHLQPYRKEAITICAVPSLMPFNFDTYLNSFVASNPMYSLNFKKELERSVAEQQLSSGSVDFVIMHTVIPPAGHYTFVPLAADPLYVLIHPNNPLSFQEEIYLENLSQETLLLPKWVNTVFSDICTMYQFRPSTKLTPQSMIDVVASVASNMGCAILFSSDISRFHLNNLVVQPLQSVLLPQFGLAYTNKHKHTDMQLKVLQFILSFKP